MDSLYLTSIICMILFVNALEISREDETGKVSMLSLNEKLRSNFKLPIKRITHDDELLKTIDQRFEKVMLFLDVFSIIDNFMYEKMRDFVRKLNAIYDIDEKYIKSCSKSHASI